MSDDPSVSEWSYTTAKRWLEDQGGLSFVMDVDGRPMVVVSAWGLGVEVLVESNSMSAQHAAFVEAVQRLAEKLTDPPRRP